MPERLRFNRGEGPFGNRLLAALTPADQALLRPHLSTHVFKRGAILVEAGDDVTKCYFPCNGTIAALIVALPDGAMTETATIGREGAVGGIVSLGNKPAFARAVIQVGGTALRIESERLEELKDRSTSLRDRIARYADCLIAQILQSVACSVLHSLEPRFCRWLLHFHDRSGGDDIPLTQEMLAEMLGVQRTTITAVATSLEMRGILNTHRGRIKVRDRPALKTLACRCHDEVVRHFERVLPGVYPLHEDRPLTS